MNIIKYHILGYAMAKGVSHLTDIYQFPYHQRPEGEIVEIDAHTYFSIPAKFTEGEKVWLVAARKTGPAIKLSLIHI